MKITDDFLRKVGFERNDWTNEGKPIYYGWQKDNLLIQKKGSRYYLDGYDAELKTTVQLRALYYGLHGKVLNEKEVRLIPKKHKQV